MPEARALRWPRLRSSVAVIGLAFLVASPAPAPASDRVLESLLEGANQVCPLGLPCSFYYLDASDDGEHLIIETGATLVAEDTDAGDDIYDRHDGRWTLITPGGGSRSQFFFEDVARDGGRVFFTSPDRLVSEDTDSSSDLYEGSSGHVRLLSIGPAGGNAAEDARFGGSSPDGSRAYFTTRESLVQGDTDGTFDLYQRAGARLERITRGAIVKPGLEPIGYFAGSSPNSTHDFFVTDRQELPEDVDDCLDIYQVVEDRISSVVPDDGRPAHCYNEHLLGVTRDASHVFFEQAPGSILVRTCFGQETTIYSPAGPPFYGAELTGFSEDRGIAYFKTDRALTPDDRDTQADIYRWENGSVERASSGPLGGNRDDSDGVPTMVGLSADGARAFFMTREPLTADDQPSVDSYGQQNLDIYMHESGKTTLVTTGTGPYDQSGQAAARVSRDGHRVIFWSLEDNSVWEWIDGALTRMIGPNGQPWHPPVLLGISRDLAHYFVRGSDTTEMYDWRLRGPRPAPPVVPASGCPASTQAISDRRSHVRIRGLRVRPRAFRAGRRRPSLGRRHGRAAVISFRLSSRSRVRFVFSRRNLVRCRKKGGGRRCVGFRRSGKLTVPGRAGRNRVYFDGVIRRGKRLTRGRYRLSATPIGAAAKGNRARFTVLARR
jgi:hypothetical protein